jgi:hypothetical protein
MGSKTSDRLDCSWDEGVSRRMVRILGPLKPPQVTRAACLLSTTNLAAVRKGSATMMSIGSANVASIRVGRQQVHHPALGITFPQR